MPSWVLWIVGGCGVAFLAILVVQLAMPETQLFPLALPFGIVGGILAAGYRWTRR